MDYTGTRINLRTAWAGNSVWVYSHDNADYTGVAYTVRMYNASGAGVFNNTYNTLRTLTGAHPELATRITSALV